MRDGSKAKEINRGRDEKFNYFIRPQTFPLAVKLCAPGDPLPEKVKKPSRDFGYRVSGCQCISLARKYGWKVVMSREDMFCVGMILLGFVERGDYFLSGQMLVDGGYVRTLEGAQKMGQGLSLLDYGKYQSILFAPLFSADFEPDLIMIYGNPAQMMRLVQGAVYENGSSLTSASAGVADCNQSIVRTLLTGECQLVLPGFGNRRYAATEKDEMSFSIPQSKIEGVLEGLKQGHVHGLRYPVPTAADYKVSSLADLYAQMFDQAGVPKEER